MNDIITIACKEIEEYFGLFLKKGSRSRFLIFILIFGIIMPITSGVDGVKTGATASFLGWMPFFLISSVVVDAIAGERERHTLESLLATRISDQAILIGKILASVIYGYSVTLGCYIINLITINIGRFSDPIFYDPVILFGAPIIALLIAIFSATLGVLVSLRSPTARQASQKMSVWMFLVMLPLLLLPVVMNMLPEEVMYKANEFIETQNLDLIGAILGGLVVFSLIIGTAILFGIARSKFKRYELILD